ncbi:MAG: hypothetical protein QM758_07425 [Armatimonas sp.]
MASPRIIDLGWIKGVPQSNNAGAGARGINNQSTIVGYCGKSAFYWMEAKGMCLLEREGYAYAINSKGDITGKAGTSPCIWKRDGSRLIIPLFAGARSAFGYSISDDGTVVGDAMVGNSPVGFRFAAGELQDLPDSPTITASSGYDQPQECNSAGEIVGAMQGKLNGVGFYLKPGALKREIIAIPGKGVTANCITGTKVYCGVGTTSRPEPPALYDTATHNLQPLDWPQGAYPMAANTAGWVVGGVETSEKRSAFVYMPKTGFRDLNELLASARGGWQLQQASAINDRNEIVGTGMLNGKKRAFLIRNLS